MVGSISVWGDTFQILVEMYLQKQTPQISVVLEAKLRAIRIHFETDILAICAVQRII
jgi:hypothetical protein